MAEFSAIAYRCRTMVPRTALFCLFAGFALGCLPSQDPQAQAQPAELDAATHRLQLALGKAKTLVATAFRAEWGDVKVPGQVADEGPEAAPAALRVFLAGSAMARGAATGSWHRGLLHVRFDGDEQDELLAAGRCTVCRSKTLGWVPRVGSFADGNRLEFVPDPERLLMALADLGLCVSHREVGELDGRPVEFLAVALSPEQVAELAHRQALPPANLSGGIVRAVLPNILAAGGAPAPRAAPPLPTAVVDLAIAIDPAAGVVHRLQFRSWIQNFGNRVVFNANGVAAQAAVQVVVGKAKAAPAEAPASETAPPTAAALRYREGLPERPCQGLLVLDYTVLLRDHGKTAAPALDTELQRLLLR